MGFGLIRCVARAIVGAGCTCYQKICVWFSSGYVHISGVFSALHLLCDGLRTPMLLEGLAINMCFWLLVGFEKKRDPRGSWNLICCFSKAYVRDRNSNWKFVFMRELYVYEGFCFGFFVFQVGTVFACFSGCVGAPTCWCSTITRLGLILRGTRRCLTKLIPMLRATLSHLLHARSVFEAHIKLRAVFHAHCTRRFVARHRHFHERATPFGIR